MSRTALTPPKPPDLELVLASLLGGVVVLSADDRVSFVNPAAEAMLARSSSSLLGQPAKELFRDAHWLADLVSRLRSEPDASLRGEGRLGPGSSAGVVAVVSVLRDRQGSPDGTVVVLHDLGSRQWLYDDELARSRLVELGAMISRVAHELNNPLAGIRGAAQLLGSKLDERPDLAKYSEMIVRQADRMAQLVQTLLALETLQPAMTRLNIHRILNDVILLAQSEAAAEAVKITTAFDPSLPEVRGNQDQLEQLFLNLLKNAVAACPQEQGRVTVGTRMENRFYIATPSERVRYIVVEVSDNGPGLDEETRMHMFSPFYSRRAGGTGLGLAIAHNIVTTHKGRISADNLEAGGARLRVSLPVAEMKRTRASTETD